MAAPCCAALSQMPLARATAGGWLELPAMAGRSPNNGIRKYESESRRISRNAHMQVSGLSQLLEERQNSVAENCWLQRQGCAVLKDSAKSCPWHCKDGNRVRAPASTRRIASVVATAAVGRVVWERPLQAEFAVTTAFARGVSLTQQLCSPPLRASSQVSKPCRLLVGQAVWAVSGSEQQASPPYCANGFVEE